MANRVFRYANIYKDSKYQLKTILYKKPRSNSEHLYSLEKSISYSQAIRMKRICTTESKFNKHSSKYLQQHIKKGYQHASIKGILIHEGIIN